MPEDYNKFPYTKEARTIVNILKDYVENMEDGEADFIVGLADRMDTWGDETLISEKQIAWLRRLEDRYAK